jgi:hypothetical protein
MSSSLENGVRELRLRELMPENVIAELTTNLEFARDFFERRGQHIIKGNIEAQLRYFKSAEIFQRCQDSELVPSEHAN